VIIQTTQAIAQEGFLPTNLQGWITVLASTGAGFVAAWAMIKNRIKEDVAAVKQDVNGYGERLKMVETEVIAQKAVMLEVRDGWRESRHDRGVMREQIGKMEKTQENLVNKLTDMQTDIIDEIQKSRDAIGRASMVIRERIVRLETVNQIENKLGHKLTEEPE